MTLQRKMSEISLNWEKKLMRIQLKIQEIFLD